MFSEWSAIDIVHKMLKARIKSGDFCIDATAGNGHDTVFLCELVGSEGKVLAMDIQQSAVDSTGLFGRASPRRNGKNTRNC